MQFEELCQEIKEVNFESLRKASQDYFEAVIVNAELKGLTDRLNRLLGLPAWPSDKSLSTQVEKEIEDFGGIMPGQILYRSIQKDCTFLAMLWPWNDGRHTTLKIIKK